VATIELEFEVARQRERADAAECLLRVNRRFDPRHYVRAIIPYLLIWMPSADHADFPESWGRYQKDNPRTP
jgi:hypothetical protein